MDDKTRITVLSVVVAVLVYFWLARDPNLPPQSLYGIAAVVGVVAGILLNLLWKRIIGKGGVR